MNASSSTAGPSVPPAAVGDGTSKKPTVIITIGMAGSGKTTFVQRINSWLHEHSSPAVSGSTSEPTQDIPSVDSSVKGKGKIYRPPYIVNLDPAVSHLPFEPNIDIRDTVEYKEVMKQYNLGPNGGILTSLNLFTTKFDQVLDLMEKRADTVDHIILDTPGQIEIFTWSASGAIITDAVASSLPTVVAYIIDTPRTSAPATFMSNMLYACSILYKTRLPFILVFNKTDVQPHQFALDWMTDFEKFQEALATHSSGRDSNGEQTYMNSLMTSMSLVLDEFYKNLTAVGVSSVTGDGIQEFFDAVEASRSEYETIYLPDLKAAQARRQKTLEKTRTANMSRVMQDLKLDPHHNKNDKFDADADGGDDMDFDLRDESGGGFVDPDVVDEDEDDDYSYRPSDGRGNYIDITQMGRTAPQDAAMRWPRPG